MRVGLKAIIAAVSATALVAGATSGAFAKPPHKGPGKVVIVKPSGGGHHHHGGGHKGRNIAIGLGVMTAAAIAAAAAANANTTSGGGGYQCRRWDRLCDEGERWACRKYHNNCE